MKTTLFPLMALISVTAACSDKYPIEYGKMYSTDTGDSAPPCSLSFTPVSGMYQLEIDDGTIVPRFWAYPDEESTTYTAEVYMVVNVAASGGLYIDYSYSNATVASIDCSDGWEDEFCTDWATETFALYPDCED